MLHNVNATETLTGSLTEQILGAGYNPFASSDQTEAGSAASCISTIVYGLRKAGYQCPYRNFRVYQRKFRDQAEILELGVTKVNDRGLVLFDRSHFTQFYEDVNGNGVVDEDDTVIHAYFHPVSITKIRDWLNKDRIRPLFYIDLTKGFACPK